MLDFSGNDEKAKLVAIHYANKFDNKVVLEILEMPRGVKNKEEAVILSSFFWDMLDAAALDKENNKVVLDESDLQHWLERSMNIISGYLKKSGYEEEWESVSDSA